MGGFKTSSCNRSNAAYEVCKCSALLRLLQRMRSRVSARLAFSLVKHKTKAVLVLFQVLNGLGLNGHKGKQQPDYPAH